MNLGKLTTAITGRGKNGASGRGSAQGQLLKRADEARDNRQYVLAAELYDQVIALGGAGVGLYLQAGHMHKEGCNFPPAEARYKEALAIEPGNAEVLLQLGHFNKIVARYAQAEAFYARAIAARPDWDSPRDELANLRRSEELRLEKERMGFTEERPLTAADEEQADPTELSGFIDRDLFPKTRDQLYINHQPAFVFTRNGNDQKSKWGTGLTLRGVDALRGYVVSAIPYLYLEIFLDGELIYTHPLIAAPQRREKSNPDIKKYVYNAWIDFSRYSEGWHELVFRAVSIRGEMREGLDWRRERVIVDAALPTDAFEEGDGLIPPLDPTSSASVVEQINARPSIVHRASTRSFPGEIKNVAVIRADQLGDMVVSVPALLRLRALLPNARITGLLSPANEGLGRSLKVFDDIVLLDFPDDPAQRQRVMTRENQEKLRRQLLPYKFDLAIDFPVSGVSYKLLPMTGAPVMMGYGGNFRTLGLSLSTHDPKTNNDMMRHSARTRAITEALALWLDSGAKVVPRDNLDRRVLAEYGISTDADFIVLHTGSRIKFTQWPYYAELAREIVDKLGMQVVYMAEGTAQRDLLPQAALESGRIVYMHEHLSFDHFDTILSLCKVFVGNDSGPKHLASLRGAQVVSIHSSRIGWSEWGQETGVVISRRVPCAGCSLHHDPEECAQGVVCITRITVEEVFREVERLARPVSPEIVSLGTAGG